MRGVKQIAVAELAGTAALFAVATDGTLWGKLCDKKGWSEWEKMPDLPQPVAEVPQFEPQKEVPRGELG